MRNIPALAVGLLCGTVASMVLGFLIASWAFAGANPAYASTDVVARADAPSPDALSGLAAEWRAAGYDRVGLWQHQADVAD